MNLNLRRKSQRFVRGLRISIRIIRNPRRLARGFNSLLCRCLRFFSKPQRMNYSFDSEDRAYFVAWWWRRFGYKTHVKHTEVSHPINEKHFADYYTIYGVLKN